MLYKHFILIVMIFTILLGAYLIWLWIRSWEEDIISKFITIKCILLTIFTLVLTIKFINEQWLT